MTKQKQRKKRKAAQPETSTSGWQPNYWMMVALIVTFLSGGIMLKALYSPSSGSVTRVSNVSAGSSDNPAIEGQVDLVAANFRCACGGCGELFLVDCTCDMPKGAVETKAFIRNKLGQGLSIDQVIQLVDKQYGHRI
jgi:cytochrome c-type biogenesis protein CcmH/NrfF